MRKTGIALAIALAMGAGAASAANVNGVTFAGGAYFEVGDVYEGSLASNGTVPILAPGDILAGVGRIDTIKDSQGNVTWSRGQNGVYLSYWFDSYKTQAINSAVPATPPFNVIFSGGSIHFYTSATEFNPTGSFAADKATISAGNLWVDATGATTRLCTAADACLDGVGTPIALDSFILSGSLGSIGSGAGNGLLNFTGGPAQLYLDTNAFPGGSDAALGSSFNSGSATAGYAASGSIDIRGVALPEPATLSVMGLALLGMAGIRRRKAA